MTTTQPPPTTDAIAFSVSVQPREPDEHLVVATGEIDVASVAQLRIAINDVLSADGGVALDLDGVTFIDSSGLCALIGGYKAAQDLGVSFRVERASHQVRRLLDITGQADRFLGDDPD